MTTLRTIPWPTQAHPFFKLRRMGRTGIEDLLLERDTNGPFQSTLNGETIVVDADATEESLTRFFERRFAEKRRREG